MILFNMLFTMVSIHHAIVLTAPLCVAVSLIYSGYLTCDMFSTSFLICVYLSMTNRYRVSIKIGLEFNFNKKIIACIFAIIYIFMLLMVKVFNETFVE